MLKFLLVIFLFFILLVFLMGFSILRTFKRMLFGSGSSGSSGSDGKKREQRRQTSSNAGKQQRQAHDTAPDNYAAADRKKIFTKDEGEYVDFEEVK